MAELKLNIYNKREIVKTYEAESYDLTFGTVEDLINLIDVDKVNLDDNSELIKEAGKIVMGGMDVLKPLYKDIFEGLTDEELRNTHLSELASVLIGVLKFAISQMLAGTKTKN